MKLICIPVGPIQSNTYIYYDENTLEAVIIDCGDEAEKIIAALEENHLKLKAILLTHGHFDHTGASERVSIYMDVPVYAGKNEFPLLEKAYTGGACAAIPPENALNDGGIFEFAGHRLKVLFTPGHSFGSVCYYDEAENLIFTGDTLFFLSVGRTDLATGNYEQLVASFADVLFRLPSNVVVYPGHGPKTTIGFEKENNPEIRID